MSTPVTEPTGMVGSAPEPPGSENDIVSSEKTWGIEVAGVHLSAAGHLLDLRYRIINPQKAVSVSFGGGEAYLVDQATGVKCCVPSMPKTGSLRQHSDRPMTNRTYSVLFYNQGRTVSAGSRVTVVLGDCRLANLTVE